VCVVELHDEIACSWCSLAYITRIIFYVHVLYTVETLFYILYCCYIDRRPRDDTLYNLSRFPYIFLFLFYYFYVAKFNPPTRQNTHDIITRQLFEKRKREKESLIVCGIFTSYIRTQRWKRIRKGKKKKETRSHLLLLVSLSVGVNNCLLYPI
jgi:hypothetical protein